MGFEVSVCQDFSAAHWLDYYEGKCSNIHGHTWTVEVSISGNKLDESGMLVDFRYIKGALNTILDKLDHTLLNEVSPFDTINPTAENIARYIYYEMQGKIKFTECKVKKVKVWESPTTWASYREE
ncbi:MAG: 6-carboxytetrahydropterin synthase QueD [Syntrophomonadaceae bacterium]|nr:6-carboxytetrahydropterin synthase QueD [Syntrophomonadaceae bacterium]